MNTAPHSHTHTYAHTHTQLMHVNSQWDMEYREQEEAFRRYRYDSQQAQSENLELIAKLKGEKDELTEEIRTLSHELEKRVPSVIGHRETAGLVAQKRVAQLEEEITLLRQQVPVRIWSNLLGIEEGGEDLGRIWSNLLGIEEGGEDLGHTWSNLTGNRGRWEAEGRTWDVCGLIYLE